jgi:hypothetical protein
MQIGSRAYAANHHMLKSKIIKRSVTVQIYKTPIRPVVTWAFTKSGENLSSEGKYCGGSMGRSKRGIFGELEIMKN